MRTTILGSGSFGIALASVLSRNGREVRLWGRSPDLARALNGGEAPALKGVPLSPDIRATADLPEALSGSELVLCAVPSTAIREVITRASPHLPAQVPLLVGTKGIEPETLLTMTELLQDVLPERFHPYLAVMSGPSFAAELAARMPTAVTVAAFWDKVAQACQQALQSDTFRLYTSQDVIGVQLGGALKNVIAIATGISDALGFGHNARAALITRGLAEITRLAVRRGANPLTLSGLSGLGDLVLTCTGELSRNRQVGIELGRGRSLREALAKIGHVAEGVVTAQSAQELARRNAVELPICEQVHAIAHLGKDPRAAVSALMGRQPKPEL